MRDAGGSGGSDLAVSQAGLRALREKVESVNEALAGETRQADLATHQSGSDLLGRDYALATALQATLENWSAKREALGHDLADFSGSLDTTADETEEVETATTASFQGLAQSANTATGLTHPV